MRVHLPILIAALFVGGCASRLPVEQGIPPTNCEAKSWAVMSPATASDLTHAVERMGGGDGYFMRCALEGEGDEGGEAEEARKRHEIAVFLGYTFERGEEGATVGIDYAYWFTERFGVGPFADFVLGDIEAFAAGAGVWFRPFRRLEHLGFQVAPGVDITREEGERGHDPESGGKGSWEVEPLLRLGVTYALVLPGGFRIVPSFYYDLIGRSKKAYVFGLSFANEF